MLDCYSCKTLRRDSEKGAYRKLKEQHQITLETIEK